MIRILTLLITITVFGQVGINTTTPKGALDINSDSKGVLIPRLNTTERTNITTPANGLILYDTNEKKFVNAVNTNNNIKWLKQKSSIEKTDFNKSLSFNGSNEYCIMYGSTSNDNNVLSKKNSEWTIAFEIKLNDITSSNGIISLYEPTKNTGLHIWIENQNIYLASGEVSNSVNRYLINTTTNFITEGYNKVLITYNGSTLNNSNSNAYEFHKIDINNETEIQNTAYVSSLSVSDVDAYEINIGRAKNTSNSLKYLNGKISTLNLTNRKLVAHELKNFIISPKGWANGLHTSMNTYSGLSETNYDFRVSEKSNLNLLSNSEMDNINRTYESNKIWLMGDGIRDGETLNGEVSIINQIVPYQNTNNTSWIVLKNMNTTNITNR
jgi:hypothetical protein